MTKKPKAKKKAVPKKKRTTKPGGMSRHDFKAALDQLGLTIAGKATAKAFGLGIRQCARMVHGKVPVSGPVGMLTKMYLRHGIPDDAEA